MLFRPTVPPAFLCPRRNVQSYEDFVDLVGQTER
jgi:hypothetical protein